MRLSAAFLQEHSAKPMEVFIETGTGAGSTLAKAAPLFRKCFSCEPDAKRHLSCIKGFSGVSNVFIYFMNSVDFLGNLLTPLLGQESATFWLDAHYSGVGPSPDVECPLLDELAVITSVNWQQKPVILIDDAYYFTDAFWSTRKAMPYTRSKWPTLEQIKKAMPFFNCEIIGWKGGIVKLS